MYFSVVSSKNTLSINWDDISVIIDLKNWKLKMPQGVNLYKVVAKNNPIRVTDVAALSQERTIDKKEKEKVSVDENSLQFKREAEKNVIEKKQ